MELHQKTLGQKRSFFLLPDKIKVCVRNRNVEKQSYFSYESLNREAKIVCQKNNRLFFIALTTFAFLGCFGLQNLMVEGEIYYVIFLIVAILLVILYRYKQQKYIFIETSVGQKIVFLLDKPNRQALETFLIQLWSYRKQYLRDKYFYIDYSSDLDRQTLRLRWLLEQNIITKAEYKLAREDWVIDKSYRH